VSSASTKLSIKMGFNIGLAGLNEIHPARATASISMRIP
jgi:hypothetical protein